MFDQVMQPLFDVLDTLLLQADHMFDIGEIDAEMLALRPIHLIDIADLYYDFQFLLEVELRF